MTMKTDRLRQPYELDFVASKCTGCDYFEWGEGRGLCFAEKCKRLPLFTTEKILAPYGRNTQ